MRIPKTPPDLDQLLAEISKNPQRLMKVFSSPASPSQDGQYLHWDKLRFHQPPKDLTKEEWWFAVKQGRRQLYQELPLYDTAGDDFQFLVVDPIPERLHQIDLQAGGHVQMPEQIINRETRDQYLVSSLIEEAITSSQLEGAGTTRKVAKAMIKARRKPRDRSERMILNNYHTMRRISQWKEEPLSKSLILDIHRLITEGTLDEPDSVGRFRKANETVTVEDSYGKVLHEPPRAELLDMRMEDLCEFANDDSKAPFIHPAIRSIILHFWLAYDHPFIDGNGRTARALFYWSMLRHGYWLFEYLSISRIINNAPAKYGRAFLYTETDENDLTYFVCYHLDIIRQAVKNLHAYLQRKTSELKRLETELREVGQLNHRQRGLIGHALRHPQFTYTIESHRTSHDIVYQTARKDLLDLAQRGLLIKRKRGNEFQFSPASDLSENLGKLGQ